MLDKIKNRKESGFTIVEVMIVLAIAGLIILVVFLAVPALQRNSRNTERTSDASLVGAAVNECLSNRNGQRTACDQTAEITPYIDTSKLRQLTTPTVVTTTTGPTNQTDIHVKFGSRCTSDGASVDTSVTAPARAVVLLFNTESQSGANVLRCQEV